MTMHTAGEWVDRGTNCVGTRWQLVASVYPMEHENPEEHAANMRLIAAAPDLLEALQEMVAGDAEAIEDAKRLGVPFPDEMLAAYHKARAAIARATGEQP